MGLEQFDSGSDVGGVPDNRTQGKTIRAEEDAIDALIKAKSEIGHSPTVDEYNSVREEIGYATPAEKFKRQVSLTFNEVKKLANLEVNEYGTPFTFNEDMKEKTEDLGYIIGVIIGDGGIYSNNDSGKWVSLQSKDKEFVCEFGEVLCEWANLEWHGFDSEKTEVSCYGPIEIDENAADNWKVLKSIASAYDFLLEYQEGNYTVSDLLDTNKEFKLGLLRGLWDSEGSISKEWKRVSFVSTEYKVIELYVRLVEEFIGEVRIYDGDGKINARIIKEFNNEFFKTVQPTIERKRILFQEDMEVNK